MSKAMTVTDWLSTNSKEADSSPSNTLESSCSARYGATKVRIAAKREPDAPSISTVSAPKFNAAACRLWLSSCAPRPMWRSVLFRIRQ